MSKGQGFGAAPGSKTKSIQKGVGAIAAKGPALATASPEAMSSFAVAARKAMAAESLSLSSVVESGRAGFMVQDSRVESAPENSEEFEEEDVDAEVPVEESSAAQEDPKPEPPEQANADIILQALRLFDQQRVQPLQRELDQSTAAQAESDHREAELQAKLDSAMQELSTASASLETLSDLGRLLGQSSESPQQGQSTIGAPGVMTNSSAGGDRMIGALAEFTQEVERSSLVAWNESSCSYEKRQDSDAANRFVRENRAVLERDLEKSMKAAGLLQGSGRSAAQLETSAPTAIVDVIGGFLPALSAIMRQNNRSGKIWHQFPTTRVDFREGEGGTVQVPRVAFQAAPANANERLLSGGGVYQGIVDTSQSINSGVVTVQVQEWGLGGSAAAPPIGIPTFVNRYSLIDLMGMLRRNLWEDYIIWEDMKARSLYAPTSRVVYNKKNSVTTSETSLVAGDKGTATIEFAEALSDYAKTLLIPPLDDGCYVWVVPTRYLTPLRASLKVSGDLLEPSPGDLTLVTDYLSNTSGGYIDRVTGYKGKIGNVHVFEGNSWGIGAPGTEGTQSETIATASRVTRSGYFFGADTTGRGIGEEFNIRMQTGEMHFNRLIRAIWVEHSGWVALDVDPTGYVDTSAVPQQLRVIETRMLDVEL